MRMGDLELDETRVYLYNASPKYFALSVSFCEPSRRLSGYRQLSDALCEHVCEAHDVLIVDIARR